jgi:hypothetical protein
MKFAVFCQVSSSGDKAPFFLGSQFAPFAELRQMEKSVVRHAKLR